MSAATPPMEMPSITPEFKFKITDGKVIKLEQLLLRNNINIQQVIQFTLGNCLLKMRLITNNPDQTAKILDLLDVEYKIKRVIQVPLKPIPGQLLQLQKCLKDNNVVFKSLNSAELGIIVRVNSDILNSTVETIQKCLFSE